MPYRFWGLKIFASLRSASTIFSERKITIFPRKKTAYFGGKQGVSSYILTTQVLKTDTWTPDVVETRQNELLGVLADKWELR